MKHPTRILSVAVAIVLALTSCNITEKQLPVQIEENLDLAVEEVVTAELMEDVFNETFDVVFDFSDYSIFKSNEGDDWPDCRVRTVEKPEDGWWPRVVTLDFGDGCEDKRGNVREGKIIITVTGKWKEEGSTRTVAFEDYYINGNKIEGTKVITNMGREDECLVFSVELTDGKVIRPDGTEISRKASKTRKWIEGEDTPERWDNAWLVNGTVVKVNKDGVTVTKTITDLVWAKKCRFPLSGTVLIECGDDRPAAVLDYGDGECDKFATITIGEGDEAEVWIIDLKNKTRTLKEDDSE